MNNCSLAARDQCDTTSLFNYLSQRVTLVWAIVLLLMMAWGLWNLYGERQRAEGGEQEWIAHSIAAGHGFSFDSRHRWLFSLSDSGEYFPTAWAEPIYPTLMAVSFKAFGAHRRFPIVVFQMISLLFTCVVLYYLGRTVFNAWTGLLAGSMLAILPAAQHTAKHYLGNATFGGLMVSISACMILWCLEKVSMRRGLALGAVLGFTCLTHAVTLLFIPLSVLLILLSARPLRPVVWKTVLAILLAAGAVVTPWTMRNLLVFEQFVPIRTGLGQITHLGNPILAETFSPDFHTCPNTSGPPWEARSATEAILVSKKFPERLALYRRAFDCIEQDAPDGYERLNEAERDKVYLRKGMDFIFSEPRLFATLTYHKSLAFFYTAWGGHQRVVALLALVGALITLRRQRARVLTLLILAYAIPYSLGIPFFYRYRYPIEPILLLLASYVLVVIALYCSRLPRTFARLFQVLVRLDASNNDRYASQRSHPRRLETALKTASRPSYESRTLKGWGLAFIIERGLSFVKYLRNLMRFAKFPRLGEER